MKTGLMPTTRRLALVLALAGLAGLTGRAGAQGSPHPPRPDRPDGSLRAPAPAIPLGFAETLRVLGAAKVIVKGLTPGEVRRLHTRQGARLSVGLLYQGQVVARALLGPDGTLAPLRRGPQLPEADGGTPAGPPDAERLAAQVQQLTVFGGVQVTPGEYRLVLMSGGLPVAVLRLDRVTLKPRPDDGVLGRPLPRP